MNDKEKAIDKKIKNHEKRLKKLEAFLGNNSLMTYSI